MGITSCASAISAVLTSKGKSVKTISATNYSCVAAGPSRHSEWLHRQRPLCGNPCDLTGCICGSIAYKGLYGTMMYASGANATGTSCIAAQLLSRK